MSSIAVNSTAFEDADPETCEGVFVGSKTRQTEQLEELQRNP